jgi:hypothetical protein
VLLHLEWYVFGLTEPEETMKDKRLEVLKSMKDHYDHLFNRVHYLLIANGAGFAGGLTILKDYTSTPQYHGVGIPIALFGIGLLAAIAAYITLSLAQMNAKNSVLDKAQHPPSMPVFYVHYTGLVISTIAFLAAIVVIIYRVAAL